MNFIKPAFFSSCVVLLTACGGGSGGGSVPESPQRGTPDPVAPGEPSTPVDSTDSYSIENYLNPSVNAANLSGIWMAVESYRYSENLGVQQLYEGAGKFRKLFFINEMESGMVNIANCNMNETITATGDALSVQDSVGAAYALTIQSNTKLTGTLQRAEGNTSLPENYRGEIALVKIAGIDQPLMVSGKLTINNGGTETAGDFASVTCFEERNSTETIRKGEANESATQHFLKVKGSGGDGGELSFTSDTDSLGMKYSDVTIKGTEEIFASADVSQDPTLSVSVSSSPSAIAVSSQFKVSNPEGGSTTGEVKTFTLTFH